MNLPTIISDNSSNDHSAVVPNSLPILALDKQVVFPLLDSTLAIPANFAGQIDSIMKGDRIVGIVSLKNKIEGAPLSDLVYEVGTAAKILFVTPATNGSMLILVRGLTRFRIASWLDEESYPKAKIALAPEVVESNIETEAMHRKLRSLMHEVFALSMKNPDEAISKLASITDPLTIAYIAAAHANVKVEERQQLLEQDSLNAKLRTLITILSREKEILAIGDKIQSDVKDEMDKSQREYYLRKQLKAIKKELGESDGDESEFEEYQRKLDETELTDEARKEVQKELNRLEDMTPQAPEYGMVKSYLDWILDLPWNEVSEDQPDITAARNILDEDHFGLQDVKDRILEFLAVRSLLAIRGTDKDQSTATSHATTMGAILCLAGPPGVGKTSLGQSIARSMGRKFARISLGGMRDEAEIRGHRRTYIGSMPGRIIQAIKRAGTRNPVFMLDEVDKVGADWRGDPSSALLEVLDPAQNATFRDHYLNVDFDLSDVMFIATANQLETIPAPLRDRMEIIQLDGYTELEKVQIAKRHLIPRQLSQHGLNDNDMTFLDEAIRKIVTNYTREAGVRQLERLIGSICRKSVVNLTTNEWSHVIVSPETVAEYLKKEKFESEDAETIDVPGIATGLAVTSVGGDILFVEATRMIGSGNIKLTGQLGDVMKESAEIAHSYVRAQSDALNISLEDFEDKQIHLHVPAGAIPKDGPSAGVAMVMTLASLFSGRPVRSDVGMTGEVTLRGRVLPVGGIKMKILAAHRAGLKTVILPKRNLRDLDDVPEEVRNTMKFVAVDRIEDALEVGLTPSNFSVGVQPTHVDAGMNQFREEVLALSGSYRNRQ